MKLYNTAVFIDMVFQFALALQTLHDELLLMLPPDLLCYINDDNDSATSNVR